MIGRAQLKLQHYSCPVYQILSIWARWVDLVRPVQDAPLQVLHVRVALLPQERRRLRAAAAHLAVHDDFLVARNLVHPLRHFAERNERRPRDLPNLVLVGLAHVEQEEVFLRVDLPLELGHVRLGFVVRSIHRHLRRCGRDAAELFVVNQRGHGRMRAAHRAIRIFLQLELAEFHPQRVVNQEPADERLADAHDQLDRFGRLNRADDAGQHAKHAALGAARHQPGGGGSGYRQR